METFKTNVPYVFFHQMKGNTQPEKCKPSLNIFFYYWKWTVSNICNVLY